MTQETAIKIPGQALEAGKDASQALITQGPLGALVILLTIAVGVLIWLLYKSKNAHITDKDVMSGVLNKHSIEVQGLLKDLKHAFENLNKDASQLNQAMKDQKHSIDNLVREHNHIVISMSETKKSVEGLNTSWQLWIAKKRP